MDTSTLSKKSKSMSRQEYVAGLRVLGHNRVQWFRDRLDADGRLVVGRTRQRDIRIKCRSVSRRHCEIVQTGPGMFILRDLHSTNGVRVAVRGNYGSWVECEEVVLQPGIHIKLGRSLIVPVDPRGECPIVARNHLEFAKLAKMTYGSANAAETYVGRSRRWIDNAIRKLLKVLFEPLPQGVPHRRGRDG